MFTLLLTVAACGTSPAAFAEEAKCGPEGSWIYTVTIPGYTFTGIETYDAGGGYTEADQLSFNPIGVASAGHGAWKSTGRNSFLLTYNNLTFDAFSSGNPTGSLVVRQTTKIDRSGNSYSGSGDYTYYGQLHTQHQRDVHDYSQTYSGAGAAAIISTEAISKVTDLGCLADRCGSYFLPLPPV
jgi:hypothetical protein